MEIFFSNDLQARVLTYPNSDLAGSRLRLEAVERIDL